MSEEIASTNIPVVNVGDTVLVSIPVGSHMLDVPGIVVDVDALHYMDEDGKVTLWAFTAAGFSLMSGIAYSEDRNPNTWHTK